MHSVRYIHETDIIGTNLLSKFHEDRKINVASRVLTRKNAPPPWQPYIIGMNLLTKFHEDRAVNVASRVLTRFYYSHIRKNVPPVGSHVFQANIIIFKLIQNIIETNLLTKFHEDWTTNVASRVKNAPPLVAMFLKQPNPFFELIQDIIGTNLLTKKNAPPPGSNVFQPTGIIFLSLNVASRVKNVPPLGSHVFQANKIIFELIQNIIETNHLTKFHEDWTINVASRVLTRFF
ncbi:hypothetical protein DPMN_130941 [Dreissena polymorpha]|uniref:Uncharacterized protein n=1 Tax=Dreissena polymorpha TaxID=45954 RepID=A0A9D4H5I4_DREPO|nr:hypothetical protein DPMN_130941 [Dreissena polymorpha]